MLKRPSRNDKAVRGHGRVGKAKNISEANLTLYVDHALSVIQRDMAGNSAASQRDRVRAALLIAPLTTLDLRERLDVMHPAMRVLELRDEGVAIDTVWVHQENAQGKSHRVGKYVLRTGDTQ